MGLTKLVIRGARQHNLKNISVEIPRNSLTVITGLSGSGKSSLAFDTIYAEGQRRYVESLSAYARQFLDQMERPEVDVIEGLSPSIAIEQKTTPYKMAIDAWLVKQGIAARPKQPIATALKRASGLVTVAIVGEKEHPFSENLACPDCGISVPQLEPRSFSFNPPYGACPACNGLVSKYDFDPSKIITDWTRPLFDGGLGPGSGSAILKRTLELGAYAHGFDLETPFEKFPARIQNMLLYGYPPSNARAGEKESAGKKSKTDKGFRFLPG